MALATALAAATSWSPRHTRTALVVLGMLSLAAPALAVEQVYIWRDQSGVVRFSPVQEPQRDGERATDSSPTCEREAQPGFVVTDANARRAY